MERDEFAGCICLQDEHHYDCPAIAKGTCHFQSLYRKPEAPRIDIHKLLALDRRGSGTPSILRHINLRDAHLAVVNYVRLSSQVIPDRRA